MAPKPHGWTLGLAIAALAPLGFAVPAAADDKPAGPTWYVVGASDYEGAVPRERIALDIRPRGTDFGVTVSGMPSGQTITFTSGSTSPGSEGPDGYSFLVSGAYDFETGTMVTPRIVGGVGMSSVGTAGRLAGSDPTARSDAAPTARIGVAADFDLGGAWGVSAEYSAMYLGEAEREGRLGESRLDQKFTVGAKVRF